MSLRSADMQNVIARTQEIGRVRQIQDKQAEVSQRQSSAQFAEKVARQLQQVPTPMKADSARISQRQERQQQQEKKRKKKGKNKGDKSGRHVDVRV